MRSLEDRSGTPAPERRMRPLLVALLLAAAFAVAFAAAGWCAPPLEPPPARAADAGPSPGAT